VLRLPIFCVLMLVSEVACVPVTTPLAGQMSAAPPEPSCGTLGPSTDPDAIARIGAMFSRPQNASELLENLKLAYDKELFIQSGFYDDANLMKFFAGTAVNWGEPRPLRALPNIVRDVVITADAHAFPQMTVTVSHACLPKYKHVSAHRSVVYGLAYNARLELRVATVPGFTVARTRAVFGTKNSGGLVSDLINDEFGRPDHVAPPTHKATLDYEDEDVAQRPDSATWRNAFTFVVGLQPGAAGPEASILNNSDRIEHIEVWQAGK